MEGSTAAVFQRLILLLRSLVLPSLVLAVRIFRMFHVPQRTPARNHRYGGKVVRRRWGACRPLERPGIPRIVPCLGSFEIRDYKVPHEDQDGDCLNEGADRDDQVQRVPTPPWLVGINAARHA